MDYSTAPWVMSWRAGDYSPIVASTKLNKDP